MDILETKADIVRGVYDYHNPPAYIDSWQKQKAPNVRGLLNEYENTVYACANLNASYLAHTALRAYRITGKATFTRGYERVTPEHDAYLRKGVKIMASRQDYIEEIYDPKHKINQFLNQPNNYMSGCDTILLTQLYEELCGTGFWLVNIGNSGEVISAWLLPSQNVKPDYDRSTGFITSYTDGAGGNTYKDICEADGAGQYILRFAMPNPYNPYGLGYSPLRAIYEPLNIANKIFAHEAALLDNQARPDAIASIKDGVGPDEAQRYEDKINAKFRKKGHGSVAVLEEDTTITPLGWKPVDLAIIEMHKLSKAFIANAYCVPLSFLETEDVNRSNMDASREMHARNALRPRMRAMETVINQHIIKRFDPTGNTFVAFDDPSPRNRELELEEAKAQATIDVQLTTARITKPSEIRVARGLPEDAALDSAALGYDLPTTDEPIEGEYVVEETEQTNETAPESTLNGAQIASASAIVLTVAQGLLPRDSGIGQLMVLLNLTSEQAETIMGSVGRGFVPATPEPSEPPVKQLLLPDFETKAKKKPLAPLPDGKELEPILKKHFEKWRKHTLGKLSKSVTKGLPSKFVPIGAWEKELAEDCLPVYEVYFSKSGKSLIQRLGASPDVFNVTNPKLKKAIEKMVYDFAESTIETTTLELNEALARLRADIEEGLVDQGQDIRRLTDRVEEIFNNAETYRAQRIAQSEASRSHHEGLREAAKASGVVKGFRLMLSSDPCELCQEVAASTPEIPLDGSFSSGEGVFADQLLPIHPNCECTVEEILED